MNSIQYTRFTTHTKEIVGGRRLTEALNKVADDWAQLARNIRKENAYARHVTEAKKDEIMHNMIYNAERIRSGHITNFTIWQRVNEALTGECVALLS